VPTGTSRCGFDIRDIQAVNVGSLLAVDFDGNEILIEDGGNAEIGIRLFLHDVAPMTGKVPIERKTGLFSLRSFSKPSLPHGYQSTGLSACRRRGTLRTNEPVRVGVLSCSRTRLGGLIVFGFRGCVGGGKSLSGSFHRAHSGKEQCADMEQLDLATMFAHSCATLNDLCQSQT